MISTIEVDEGGMPLVTHLLTTSSLTDPSTGQNSPAQDMQIASLTDEDLGLTNGSHTAVDSTAGTPVMTSSELVDTAPVVLDVDSSSTPNSITGETTANVLQPAVIDTPATTADPVPVPTETGDQPAVDSTIPISELSWGYGGVDYHETSDNDHIFTNDFEHFFKLALVDENSGDTDSLYDGGRGDGLYVKSFVGGLVAVPVDAPATPTDVWFLHDPLDGSRDYVAADLWSKMSDGKTLSSALNDLPDYGNGQKILEVDGIDSNPVTSIDKNFPGYVYTIETTGDNAGREHLIMPAYGTDDILSSDYGPDLGFTDHQVVITQHLTATHELV